MLLGGCGQPPESAQGAEVPGSVRRASCSGNESRAHRRQEHRDGAGPLQHGHPRAPHSSAASPGPVQAIKKAGEAAPAPGPGRGHGCCHPRARCEPPGTEPAAAAPVRAPGVPGSAEPPALPSPPLPARLRPVPPPPAPGPAAPAQPQPQPRPAEGRPRARPGPAVAGRPREGSGGAARYRGPRRPRARSPHAAGPVGPCPGALPKAVAVLRCPAPAAFSTAPTPAGLRLPAPAVPSGPAAREAVADRVPLSDSVPPGVPHRMVVPLKSILRAAKQTRSCEEVLFVCP